MIIRTLLFFVLMYLLIKVISRLFLSSGSQNRRKSKASFIYHTFRQFQQNQQQDRQNQNGQTGTRERFEEIEEAEYEDVTEEEKSTSKSD